MQDMNKSGKATEIAKAALAIATAVVATVDNNEHIGTAFLWSIVNKFRTDGTLGWYLEYVPPDNMAVWNRFHAMISKTAMEMARERRKQQ